MTVQRPTPDQLQELSDRLALGLTRAEIDEFTELVDSALKAHDWLDDVDDSALRIPTGSRVGNRPAEPENPLGAWYWKAAINAGVDGPLSGKTVAVKDNICVAGIPMMNGTDLLEGYVPERDATVVSRVLAAGGTIAGKAVCEALCYSGLSHTSATGPVRNPFDLSRSSGGSSSGCAALLAAGEVDLAIGGDQGGSIRCPSSWCGVYGLKPTYGLVPYTGAFPLEMTIDHLGPMGRSSRDVAVLLDVLAGPDGLDPRQSASGGWRPTGSYAETVEHGVRGVQLGVLEEGFGCESSEGDVDSIVRAAASELAALGADVRSVSVPWHRHGGKIIHAIAAEGSTALLVHGEGAGSNWRGSYPADLIARYATARRAGGHMLPPMLKLQALVGEWMHETYYGTYYAKAQNISRRLTAAYDEALNAVDLLLLPTTPFKATELPTSELSAADSARHAHDTGPNTSPFNVTGHPAMSIPCGISNGLPVGLQIVGRHGDEGLILRVAHAFELNVFAAPSPAAAAHPAGLIGK
jgi:amidase